MIHEPKAWTLARGLNSVSLRSNIIRTEAQAFYEQLGYERIKTQHAYRKRLAL